MSILKDQRTALGKSVTFKLIGIVILILLLQIPLAMIQSVVREREMYNLQAMNEVASSWGGPQLVGGPVLSIPYSRITYSDKGKKTIDPTTYYIHMLPENLDVSGNIVPETRERGIFKALLYTTQLDFKGQFVLPEIPPDASQLIHWDKAIVSVGMNDVHALKQGVSVSFAGKQREFESIIATKYLPFETGLMAAISDIGPSQASAKSRYDFSFTVALSGSQSLDLLPMARSVHAELQSSWPSPSFSGAYLPTTRTITEKGFNATWDVLGFSRNYPQYWYNDQVSMQTLNASAFGVHLYLPVDTYMSVTRSVKYGALFIVLTFVTFFISELLMRLRIHPIQYLLVGSAMCLFYLLFLSLAEQIALGIAYLVASFATITLITVYSAWTLHAKSRALLMGAILSGLYGYLYVLLKAEDFSLLFGSIGLFIILTGVMFITRKINWYQLGDENTNTMISSVSE